MTSDDKVWISICEKHTKKNYECSLCKSGYYTSYKELDKDQNLFINNYPEWFKKHNNGEEPNESALEIWRSITGKEE